MRPPLDRNGLTLKASNLPAGKPAKLINYFSGLVSAWLRPAAFRHTLRWLFIVLGLGGIAAAIWARVDDWKQGFAVFAILVGVIAASLLARTTMCCDVIAFAIILFLISFRPRLEPLAQAASLRVRQ